MDERTRAETRCRRLATRWRAAQLRVERALERLGTVAHPRLRHRLGLEVAVRLRKADRLHARFDREAMRLERYDPEAVARLMAAAYGRVREDAELLSCPVPARWADAIGVEQAPGFCFLKNMEVV